MPRRAAKVDATLAQLLKDRGLPLPEMEVRFHDRKWRFDYAWPSHRLALEVEGGAWTRGRHTRGKGFIADMEKYNEAAVLGWTVLRVTPQQLRTDYTMNLLDQLIH